MNFCILSTFERLQERFYLIDVVASSRRRRHRRCRRRRRRR